MVWFAEQVDLAMSILVCNIFAWRELLACFPALQ